MLDDVRAIVDELITLLQLNGIAAVGAATLDEAMAALEATPSITVVACDVRLGIESGLTILPRIEAHPRLAGRVFHYIFITGDPMHPDCLPAAGERILLTKPVKPRALIDLVKRLIITEDV